MSLLDLFNPPKISPQHGRLVDPNRAGDKPAKARRGHHQVVTADLNCDLLVCLRQLLADGISSFNMRMLLSRLDTDDRSIRGRLLRLIDAGHIERFGEGSATLYHILSVPNEFPDTSKRR